MLVSGSERAAACKKGGALWHRMLKTGGSDVRHGTSCSLLTDEEARSYGIQFNSGFGEFGRRGRSIGMCEGGGATDWGFRADLRIAACHRVPRGGGCATGC
jgi:hypothetical protein